MTGWDLTFANFATFDPGDIEIGILKLLPPAGGSTIPILSNDVQPFAVNTSFRMFDNGALEVQRDNTSVQIFIAGEWHTGFSNPALSVGPETYEVRLTEVSRDSAIQTAGGTFGSFVALPGPTVGAALANTGWAWLVPGDELDTQYLATYTIDIRDASSLIVVATGTLELTFQLDTG